MADPIGVFVRFPLSNEQTNALVEMMQAQTKAGVFNPRRLVAAIGTLVFDDVRELETLDIVSVAYGPEEAKYVRITDVQALIAGHDAALLLFAKYYKAVEAFLEEQPSWDVPLDIIDAVINAGKALEEIMP